MCCSFCRSMKICNLWMKSRLFGREAWNWMEWCEIHVKLAQMPQIFGKNHFEEQIHLKTFVYQHRFPVLHAARVSRLKCCMVFLEDWRQSDDLCFAFQRLFTFIYVLLSCQCVGNVGQQNCGEKGDGLKWRKWIDHVNYVWRLFSQTSKTQLAWCSTTPHRFLYLRLITLILYDTSGDLCNLSISVAR